MCCSKTTKYTSEVCGCPSRFFVFVFLIYNYADSTAVWCSVCAVYTMVHTYSSFAFLCDYWTLYINTLQYTKCIWYVPFTWHLTEYSVMNYIFNIIIFLRGRKIKNWKILQELHCNCGRAYELSWHILSKDLYTDLCNLYSWSRSLASGTCRITPSL